MEPRLLIYGLSDPRTGELRYIGKSSCGQKRARSHCYPSAISRDRTRTGAWIKSLRASGLKPAIDVLEQVQDASKLSDAERFWIASLRATGAILLNHTDGGEGTPGRVMSAPMRTRLREASLGNQHALGKKQVLSIAQRATLANRARLRSGSAEIRAKISRTLSGRKTQPCPLARRLAISSSLRGHPVSAETRQRQSEAAKRRWQNHEAPCQS